MAGNHDYIGARSNYPGFAWDEKVHMFLSDTIDSIYLPDINTTVYGFSYHQRDITEPIYDRVKPLQKDTINILLAHGGDEKNIPINYKKLLGPVLIILPLVISINQRFSVIRWPTVVP